MNSIYLSLWLINFVSVCARVAATPRWQFVMFVYNLFIYIILFWLLYLIILFKNINRILPLLFAIPVIGEIVKTASLLSAIAELNVSVMGNDFQNIFF